MLDLFNNVQHASFETAYLAGTSALMIGLAGSLHCVGMCSPLVIATSQTKTKNFFYQIGRLLGYLFLGSISGLIVDLLNFNGDNEFLGLFAALTIGVGLIIMGASQLKFFQQRSLHFNFSWPEKIYKRLFLFSKSFDKLAPMIIGFSSIFLPCGFLYGVVLAAGATSKPLYGAIALFFFWLGTLPAVSFGPEIIRRIFKPIKEKLPNTSSIFLMGLGLLTISYRIFILYSNNDQICH